MSAGTVAAPITPNSTTFGRRPRMRTVRDTWLIYRRSLVLTIRQPVWIVFGIMYPVLYLVLFGPLLNGAVSQAGAGVNAYNWFVPGLLIQVALFGTAFGGFGLIAELRYGVIERMRVTPMSRTAMLLGRSLRDVTILLAQALIMIALAIPFGLHIDPVGVVVTLGLLALVGLVVAPLSYAAALKLKSEDAFAPLVQGIVMPLLLLSGILLPMALAPQWLQTLSNINPLTHAVDAARALFNSDWGNPEIAIGVAISGILAVVAVWVAARTFAGRLPRSAAPASGVWLKIEWPTGCRWTAVPGSVAGKTPQELVDRAGDDRKHDECGEGDQVHQERGRDRYQMPTRASRGAITLRRVRYRFQDGQGQQDRREVDPDGDAHRRRGESGRDRAQPGAPAVPALGPIEGLPIHLGRHRDSIEPTALAMMPT